LCAVASAVSKREKAIINRENTLLTKTLQSPVVRGCKGGRGSRIRLHLEEGKELMYLLMFKTLSSDLQTTTTHLTQTTKNNITCTKSTQRTISMIKMKTERAAGAKGTVYLTQMTVTEMMRTLSLVHQRMGTVAEGLKNGEP
jgi:hypothetical protein